MQGVELGPLPESITDTMISFGVSCRFHGSEQRTDTAQALRKAISAYAAAEVAKERERCAKICESIENSYWKDYKAGRYSTHTEGMSDGAGECAAAIRAQK